MRQAITTKYAGPTDHHDSRVIAKCQAKRIIVPWDRALDVAANHERAALMLVAQLGWSGFWAGGALPDGHGYCFVDCDNGSDLDRGGYLKRVYNAAFPCFAVEAGRVITRNGKPFVSINRMGLGSDCASPIEADAIAKTLAYFLALEVK